jgi:glycosyltransferase A (GT-A) superfamily protein (DUF2064 family)
MRLIEDLVHYKGGSQEEMKNWLGSDLEYVEQCEGDLGDKMLNSVLSSFLEGNRYLIIWYCAFLNDLKKIEFG